MTYHNYFAVLQEVQHVEKAKEAESRHAAELKVAQADAAKVNQAAADAKAAVCFHAL